LAEDLFLLHLISESLSCVSLPLMASSVREASLQHSVMNSSLLLLVYVTVFTSCIQRNLFLRVVCIK